MKDLHTLYTPITAKPSLCDDMYQEFLPSNILKPYIVCYWGNENIVTEKDTLIETNFVIPQACIDLIVQYNHEDNSIYAFLTTIQESAFWGHRDCENQKISRFAIRFYGWSAHLFFNTSMKNTNKEMYMMHSPFPEWINIVTKASYLTTMPERIKLIEEYLLSYISNINFDINLYHALHTILSNKGTLSIEQICTNIAIGKRQLERIFSQKIGISIKAFSGIIRYQNLWKDIAMQEVFPLLDLVSTYNFSDSAHLLNTFRKYHGVYPHEAKELLGEVLILTDKISAKEYEKICIKTKGLPQWEMKMKNNVILCLPKKSD
ncbi:MAG: DUF6597 domain-containing transcriptional factor [Coprobacillaceae bacterium]